jgi:general secretion pathway protein L
VYVDAHLLPWLPDTLTLLMDGERTLLRWAAHEAGAIDTVNLDIFLSHLIASHDPAIRHIELLVPSESSAAEASLQLTTAIANWEASWNVTSTRTTLEGSAETYLAQRAASHRPQLNVLQGELAPARDRNGWWQRWRTLTVTLGIAASAFVVLNLALGTYLAYQGRAMHAENMALYRDLFPQDRRVINLRKQFQNHLDTLAQGGGSPFLDMFAVLAREIGKTPTESPLQMRSLLYDNATSTLSVDLTAARIDNIDELNKRLNTPPLKSTIQSVSDDGDRVIGHMSLRSE